MRRGDRRAVVVALVFLVAMAFLGSAAWGQRAEAATAGEGNQALTGPRVRPWDYGGPDIPWSRLVSGTLLVVALICVGVYALKKLNGGAPLTKGRYLEVLETRPVGRNVQLILVRVAGRILLLAFGGESVTPVAELSESELPQATVQPTGLNGFKALIKKLSGSER